MEKQAESYSTKRVFTVGHSNHPIECFLTLLDKHDIEVLVDIRSSPFSKFAPHFNQDNLKYAITNAGRKYLYLGRELGGKPKETSYYDAEGHVLYWKIAESALFQSGIERLRNGLASYAVSLMCSEEDPSQCHRRLLVGRVLKNFGIDCLHIRANGLAQSELALEHANKTQPRQITIFPQVHADEHWRSAQPVNDFDETMS